MSLEVVRYPATTPGETAALGHDRSGLITLAAFCTLPLATSALFALVFWLLTLVQ